MKKIISIILCIAMLVPILAVSTEEVVAATEVKVGDFVEFGKYNDKPIKWRIIKKDSNGFLLNTTDYSLCYKQFDAKGKDATYHKATINQLYGSNSWKDSNLRQWLNSDQASVSWTHCPPD